MKKLLSYFVISFSSLLCTSIYAEETYEVVVTGYATTGAGVYSFETSTFGITKTQAMMDAAVSQSRERYERCMIQARSYLAACKKRASNALESNQGFCTGVAAVSVLTLTWGGYIAATPGGQLPGGIVMGTGGLIGVGSTYCFNKATNVKESTDAACEQQMTDNTAICSRS